MRPYLAVLMTITWSGLRQLALNVSHLQYSTTLPATPPLPLSTPTTSASALLVAWQPVIITHHCCLFWDVVLSIIIIIISLLKTHVRRTCLHSKISISAYSPCETLCRNLQLNVPVKLYNLYWYRFLDSRVIKYFNDDDDYDDDDDDDDKILVLIFGQLYKFFLENIIKIIILIVTNDIMQDTM